MMNRNYEHKGFAAERFSKLAAACSSALAVIGLTAAVAMGATMMSAPVKAAEAKDHNEIILEKIENEEPLDFKEIVDDIDYNFTVFDEEGEEV